MASIWIDDGLSQTEVITPTMDINGKSDKGAPLTIKFRPPMGDTVLKMEEDTALSGHARVNATYEFCAAHLTSWDNKSSDGKETLPSVDNLKRLPPAYLFAIRDAIIASIGQFAAIVKN